PLTLMRQSPQPSVTPTSACGPSSAPPPSTPTTLPSKAPGNVTLTAPTLSWTTQDGTPTTTPGTAQRTGNASPLNGCHGCPTPTNAAPWSPSSLTTSKTSVLNSFMK